MRHFSFAFLLLFCFSAVCGQVADSLSVDDLLASGKKMERELRYAEALRVYQQCALVSVGEKSSTGDFSRKKCWKRRQQGFFPEKSAGNAVNRAFFQKKVLKTPTTGLFFRKKCRRSLRQPIFSEKCAVVAFHGDDFPQFHVPKVSLDLLVAHFPD